MNMIILQNTLFKPLAKWRYLSINRLGLFTALLLLFLLSGCDKAPPSQTSLSQHRLVEGRLVDGALSKDGLLAVTLSLNGDVNVWDLVSKQAFVTWRKADFNDDIYQLMLSGDKQYLLAASQRQLFLLDVTTGERLLNWQAEAFNPDANISSIHLNYSASQILVGMSDGSINTVDRSSNSLSLFKQHSAEVSAVAFLSSSDQVLSTGHDGELLIWATATGKVHRRFALPHRIMSLAIDSANRRLFAADALDNHFIIDPESASFSSMDALGASVNLQYVERYRYFRRALFVKHGNMLITATSKQDMIGWDSQSGAELVHWRLQAYSASTSVTAMAVNGEGQLVTLSSDGAIELWPL
ncbi:WD-40 repeat [Shewanella denitrificans OS217]|jgi:WD40 repeat protein|uniref:WD-40 repeat n=1 Tax=Shewanella denitrificans (strain OS217 / ATCC BAA-1090 / DSM 15013) TaxID=318161 RepID=Q12IG8_SHEDO|nr:PQQ-binding-like beta-propeller repeat protein [Shewanella denitrificans]ABE56758.1 WD-40 repeat [Shewanella denitrificans OS217]